VIKFVYCITKRSGMTDEAFRTYWHEKHGAFIRSIAPALHAKKYIQSQKIDTPINQQLIASRGLDASSYDGVTEIWWETMDDFLAGVTTPEGQAAAQQYIADEANFVDFSASRAFLTEEHTVFDFS